jgi:repressor LexA
VSLNKRQAEIYAELKRLLKQGLAVPTVAELGSRFGITQQAMSKNLKTLEKAGLIRRDHRKHRSIELVESPPQARPVKFLGRIAAGHPIEAIENDQTIEVPVNLLPASNEIYALEVSGDSMIEDGILDGDIVIIRRQTMAFNGQTIVAIIDNEATLKRYYHEGDRIRLQPANASLDPMFIGPEEHFEIRGVAFALYRRFDDPSPH